MQKRRALSNSDARRSLRTIFAENRSLLRFGAEVERKKKRERKRGKEFRRPRTFRPNLRERRLAFFFRQNSHIISGPAILSPRLRRASIINSATKYHIPSPDPFIRHSNGVFLRSRVVPSRKHVNTYDVPRAAQTISFDDVHQPFLILHAPPAAENDEPPNSALPPPASSRQATVRYALLRRPALRDAFGNISSPARDAARFAFFPPPTRGLLQVTRSRRDKGGSQIFTPPWNDVGRY